jgi:capping protein beta
MASDDELLNSALNLMRRMPPWTMENSLAGLIELVPQLEDELLNHIDQPLKVEKDTKAGRDFILCDYNRDGNSYRSPWSNKYYPTPDEPSDFLPSAKLRAMEVEANEIFDTYRHLYFEGGNSSVYFFNTDESETSESFGACFLIHKEVAGVKGIASGWWDSIHVFEVSPASSKGSFDYSLTTTVMVSMSQKSDKVDQVNLAGSLTQQKKSTLKMDKTQPHIANLGKMLEDMELKLRNSIEGLYIQKTRQVINGMRSVSGGATDALAEIFKAGIKLPGKK